MRLILVAAVLLAGCSPPSEPIASIGAVCEIDAAIDTENLECRDGVLYVCERSFYSFTRRDAFALMKTSVTFDGGDARVCKSFDD